MNRQARKILLPTLTVTELANEADEGAIRVVVPIGDALISYHARAKRIDEDVDNARRIDGKPSWVGSRFNLYPVILGSDGTPWAEANIYILSRLENTIAPNMATYAGIADDLAAYRHYLDDEGIEWMHFPQNKLRRPTYRYNGYLRRSVSAEEMAASSAKRRMGTVISFYNWLKEEGILIPENAPWKEADRYIELRRPYGTNTIKRVVTTDVSIHVPKQINIYTDTINDGGQLRPLPHEEQEWLIDALTAQGNTEMMFIHLMGILTGARIQTILTFRVKHVLAEIAASSTDEVRIPVGQGTGIDTKYNKKMVLHIPVWFYQMLNTYACSERARKRRERAVCGNTEDQYLFLSFRGTPLYYSKDDSRKFNHSNTLHHGKTGQGVRQFITERIIPFIRTKYNEPQFHYRFHDTRATFGMNLTDDQLTYVEQGKITLSAAREFVKTRMGHKSSATTDLYLQYRHNLEIVRQINMRYENHLKALCEKAVEGLL